MEALIYFIAFSGGSLSMIVYHDAIEQGKRKRVGQIRAMIVALVTSILFLILFSIACLLR